MKDHTFLFQGAGSVRQHQQHKFCTHIQDNFAPFVFQAACGIASYLVLQMMEDGLTENEAIAQIWMNDADGMIVHDRPAGMSGTKAKFAKNHRHINNFEQVVELVKPNILIGACATAGVFNENVLRNMAKWSQRPVIFALSNPTSKAECTAEEAYTYTDVS